jgi:hypothetical protein
MSIVVVVLPLLPVMHTILASVYLPANSISLITGICFASTAAITGTSTGMPGLFTTSSAASMRAMVWEPSSNSIPSASSTAR